MPEGKIEIRHPGERGADATVVLNFGEAGVVEAMDVAFFFKQISAYKNEQGEDALGEVLHGFPASWDRADLDTHPVFQPEGSLLR